MTAHVHSRSYEGKVAPSQPWSVSLVLHSMIHGRTMSWSSTVQLYGNLPHWFVRINAAQAAHELEAASLRGAISAAQETAEELRTQAEEQACAASVAQKALQERLEQLQADAASLEAAKGET